MKWETKPEQERMIEQLVALVWVDVFFAIEMAIEIEVVVEVLSD